MDTMKICPGCHKPLAPDAPDGLCPECLVKAGLPSGMDVGPESDSGSGRVAFTAPALSEVARLFPQLEILGLIGQGGMGAVYRARQRELDRVVALKILPPDIGRDTAFAERFTREARALAKLNHSGIVTLYEFGRADGLFFFLMEYVDGVNLRQLLQAGRVSPREALGIVPQICDALQYAHDHGIVHRDIKPENILVDRHNRVKVADFGLAKLVGQASESGAQAEGAVFAGSMLTEAGKVMGTPQYMAPEQREHPNQVDHRADIYSLGVVFYQMLTGELPGKDVHPPSSRLQGVRLDLRIDDVVLRALQKEPERRYQHVSEVKTDVEHIAGNPSQGAGSGDPCDRREPEAGPRPAAVAIKPNNWEAALIAGGLMIFIMILVLAPTSSPSMREFLKLNSVLGLCICALTLAGWWPAPSFGVPDSGFSRRNLHYVGALSLVSFISAFLSGLIPTIFFWLAPWLVPWLTPLGQEVMLWLTFCAAFIAVMTGISSRRAGLGRTGMIVGSVNLALWLLFFLAGELVKKPETPQAAADTSRVGTASPASFLKPAAQAAPAARGDRKNAAGTNTFALLPEADRTRALSLFNDIENFSHEFEAAFAAKSLPAAKIGVARLVSMIMLFNEVVQGTDCEFSAALIQDVERVAQALNRGDWEAARRLARHNETHAREFKRISAEMVAQAKAMNWTPGDTTQPALRPR